MGDGYGHAKEAWGSCILCCALKVALKECFADMEVAEQVIESERAASALNITVVRATILSDKGEYFKNYTKREKNYTVLKADERGSDKCCGKSKMTFMIDRQHVAEAFLDLCETDMWD